MKTSAAALIFWIVSIGLPCGASSLLAAEESAPPTPAAALAAFSRTLGEGDAVTLATLVNGDAAERAWVIAFAAQLRALRDLEQALARRYGKDYSDGESGKEIRERIETARDDDLWADLKRAKLGKADGETALVILDEAASDDRQGRLVRVDGRWKMEIGSLSNYFSVDDTPGLRALADAAAGFAKDVGAGKFPSLEEAGKAIEERLSAAEEIGAKKPQPAAAPATKPKPKRP